MLAARMTAVEREEEGVEKFAMACGLAEWKRTIPLTQGRSDLFEKFEIPWFLLPPQPVLMERWRWHIVIIVVVRTRLFLVRIPQRKLSKFFSCFRFREFGGRFKR